MFSCEDIYGRNIVQIFLLCIAACCVLYMIWSSEPDTSTCNHVDVVCECSCEASASKAHQRVDVNLYERNN